MWNVGRIGATTGDQLGAIDAILADTNELQTDDVPGLISALNDPTAAVELIEVRRVVADRRGADTIRFRARSSSGGA